MKQKSIIPGFGLSFGITMAILSLVVLIPLYSLVAFTVKLSPSEFLYTITRPRILSGYYVSISTALTASLINAVMGLILAWVLVRYEFPGKRFLDGIILRVIFPEILPSLISGFTLAFARSIGEYGSVVFIAGNTPYETEIAPLLIMSELQEVDYPAATSIALVMLAIAFVILSVNAMLQSMVSRRISGLS